MAYEEESLVERDVDDDSDGSLSPVESEAKPKRGWKGDLSNRFTGSKPFSKPKQMLVDYRLVYKGKLTAEQMRRPSIMAVMQLKLEDNARFLADLAKLEKEHDERCARKAAAIHKGIVEKPAAVNADAASVDKNAEDTLLMLEDLLVEAETAAGV